MRVFLSKVFKRWQRRNRVPEDSLLKSVEEMEQGLIDVVLGGNLVKKRVARAGGGKSGGYRTIIAYVEGEKSFFLTGFAKNEKDNVSDEELKVLQEIGAALLSYDDVKLEYLLERGSLFEIGGD